MLYAAVPASFQDIDKTHQVRIDVGMRVDQGISHSCLGRKIHDRIEPVA